MNGVWLIPQHARLHGCPNRPICSSCRTWTLSAQQDFCLNGVPVLCRRLLLVASTLHQWQLLVKSALTARLLKPCHGTLTLNEVQAATGTSVAVSKWHDWLFVCVEIGHVARLFVRLNEAGGLCCISGRCYPLCLEPMLVACWQFGLWFAAMVVNAYSHA